MTCNFSKEGLPLLAHLDKGWFFNGSLNKVCRRFVFVRGRANVYRDGSVLWSTCSTEKRAFLAKNAAKVGIKTRGGGTKEAGVIENSLSGSDREGAHLGSTKLSRHCQYKIRAS